MLKAQEIIVKLKKKGFDLMHFTFLFMYFLKKLFKII
jgi:hypothetical protein